MAKTPIDSEMIRSLAALLDETNLSEIEYEAGGLRLRVARNAGPTLSYAPPANPVPATTTVAATAAAQAADPANNPGAVKSPMVGVVYLSPDPDAPRFVNVGDSVAEGQTLLLIEAMKTFNTIRATKSGKVEAILVESGQPVEFGEPLLIIG
ncbi:acetyl-CoA carboxylase biotin carboxyl carrier protein [Telmatospirillum sp.]|uniref:acetyl-CoA carboxylase biotin carboxyl carrier protein n=1 Tax=Telmatospirillum sp. TaxID=2079197 RepID=UPI00283D1AC8|nr:acetyl-CoA carboxylase biotin carboxyl carrier protein [Telmatospirillum sp.]MDR3439363.1 acetyl-CoA carboxylase biotin carboxyl carrier protein [Telmatospirillum sp.]